MPIGSTLNQVTDVQNGDFVYLMRPSLGAAGSKIIKAEDFEPAIGALVDKYIYTMAGQMLEIQAGNAIIMGHMPTEDLVIPSAANRSCGIAKVAATGVTVFTIKKNGTSIGTMSFAAGGSVPVFNYPSDVSVVGGTDYIEVFNPASPDATLNGIYFSIWGRR